MCPFIRRDHVVVVTNWRGKIKRPDKSFRFSLFQSLNRHTKQANENSISFRRSAFHFILFFCSSLFSSARIAVDCRLSLIETDWMQRWQRLNDDTSLSLSHCFHWLEVFHLRFIFFISTNFEFSSNGVFVRQQRSKFCRFSRWFGCSSHVALRITSTTCTEFLTSRRKCEQEKTYRPTSDCWRILISATVTTTTGTEPIHLTRIGWAAKTSILSTLPMDDDVATDSSYFFVLFLWMNKKR